MPRITIGVHATAGSAIGRTHGVDHTVFARPQRTDGWPIGWGHVSSTAQSGRPLEALVLMTEPAAPGVVHGWPTGVLHLGGDAQSEQVLVCVTEVSEFIDLTDLTDHRLWNTAPDDWLRALRHMRPHTPRHMNMYGGADDARALVASEMPHSGARP